ncbi:DUF2992 family protein [Staphylococcus caprae]|uniref:DUF2992 family protein n=1 Tax=Staphylococcus caprae TaxID=29380 RepID=UPI003B20CCF5
MKLSVFHDGQFFIGLVEFSMNNSVKFSKHIFGQEPSDEEVIEFIINDLERLIDNTQTQTTLKTQTTKVNPKRLQRKVAKEQKKPKFTTIAQEAMKKEQELKKKERKKRKKQNKEKHEAYKRSIKKQKAKEKHKGH